MTRAYFDDERNFSPADLLDLRSATVKLFGVLAARHGFEPFCESRILSYLLQKFLVIQERFDHQSPDDVSFCIIFMFNLI